MSQSKVKKFFTQVTSKLNKCDLCFKLVQGSNTTNMKVHLQKWHKQAYQSLEAKLTPQVVISQHCDVSINNYTVSLVYVHKILKYEFNIVKIPTGYYIGECG